EMIRIAGCHLVVELMRQGRSPQEACEEAVKRVYKKTQARSKDLQVGFIALNNRGEHGAYCLQPGFTYAIHREQSGNQLFDGTSLLK
ncbi:MAG: isoaspartyl peptidase/L-asparaginase, partial [Bacteroidota bacterium]